eukprot:GEZU01018054.1.p1 GENE.GEZU01018054.1~~GEZU01018054.1.p1  ORF type:complete len:188 (-),score=52.10 GEZU01018054.1:183-668(-)
MRATVAIVLAILAIAAILSVVVDAKKIHHKKNKLDKLFKPLVGDDDCECTVNDCQCCGSISAHMFGKTWSANACVAVAVDFDNESATVTLDLDGNEMFNQTYTTGDVPKWCADFLGATVCLQLENTFFTETCFETQAYVGLSIFGAGFGPWKIGTFTIGHC